jgi:hypothetical protein
LLYLNLAFFFAFFFQICDSLDSAALIIACEPDANIPTVIENWLFDCIEQFEGTTVFVEHRLFLKRKLT